jgi:hypothetical protein
LCVYVPDWDKQNPTQIVTDMCGFVTILSGTFLLHKTKDMAGGAMRRVHMCGSPSRQMKMVKEFVLDVFRVEENPSLIALHGNSS